ncbi:hypothetical protein AURDEDRAFT_122207 [Auricularia subglabra TFB-10046 SS5]|nr:hypothetical protein AURDEDRAFT_122207 [Auricularia subglabra TFB-10046 SS5]
MIRARPIRPLSLFVAPASHAALRVPSTPPASPRDLLPRLFDTAALRRTVHTWDSSVLQKPWLCSIAPTSRVVWTIVKPALYDTVLLSSFRIHRILACADSGNFALTRRLWCASPYAVHQSAQIALVFACIQYFEGWDALFFELCAQTNACFRPTEATLRLNHFGAPWPHLRSLRHLTHLHLAFATYRMVSGHIGALDAPCALQVVIVSSLQHQAQPAELTHAVLPFFFAFRSLARLVVRVSPDPELRLQTVRALEEYVLLTGEDRLWTSVKRRDADALYPGAIAIAEDKWLYGERITVGA